MPGFGLRLTRFPVLLVRVSLPLVIASMLTVVALTSGCGFKLRGEVEIPPEFDPMFIQPSGGSRLKAQIVQQLQGSQVRLAARAEDAGLILRIGNEESSSRVVAVDRNGKALAYELHYRVAFDAVARDGKQLVPPQALDVVRTYDNPDVQVLGKQLEGELIYQDMVQDAAIRILNRLRAILL